MTEAASSSSFRPAVALLVAGLFAGACSEGTTEPDVPVPTTISLSRTALSFPALGDTVRLTATVRDQDGNLLTGTTVTWSSSNPDVATVSGSGLVTAAGNGDATVTASAGDIDGDVSVDVEQVPVRLRFTPDPVTLPQVDDTVTVVATVVDANDFPMPTGAVSWSSDHPDVVDISDLGLATARSEGRTRLSATADGMTGELAAFVGDAVVVIGSVSPSTLVDGEQAVIRGLGFDPALSGNTVRLGGFDATVTSASSVELRFVVPDADCSPPREATLRVDARGMTDSTVTAVHPPSLVDLAAGEGMYVTDGCLHLAAGQGDASYVVGILSSSEVPSSLTPARLAARTGSKSITLATGPARTGSRNAGTRFTAPEASSGGATVQAASAAGSVDLRALAPTGIDRSGEARVRAAERRWMESLGPLTPSPRPAPMRAGAAGAPPSPGQVMNLLVPGDGCALADATSVTAKVVYVGNSVAFLEDEANPAPGFTQSEYTAFDDFLTRTTLDVITDYFGTFSDVDANQRVLVLLTQEVNKRENLAGFVFSGDLASLAGQSCAGANDAEIFYGLAPDPNGVANPEREVTKDQLQLVDPPLIAHELTHVLQFVSAFTEAGLIKSSWELEGGATLAEQLVGYEVFGEGPRMDLGYTAWRQGATHTDDVPNWYYDWVGDMALYFGYQGEDPPLATAPEECSWVGRPATEGNDGPCEPSRAVYGVPSTLLRWTMDRHRSSAVEDQTFMRRVTSSPFRGFATLEDATDEDILDLLVPFAVTLWADGNPALPAEARDWLPSWNVYEIFEGINNENARLRPYVRDGVATPELEVSVRAASSAYLEWTPPLDHDPTSLRIRAPVDGGALPEHMVLWVLRVR